MMNSRVVNTLLLLAGLCFVGQCNRLLELSSPEEYMDICMDGMSHKSKPGPESSLFKQCEPWKDRSCCTEKVAQEIHLNETWYKMDWSHCPQKLSEKCRGHFIQDLCFYECSPNVGPWLVKVDGMKIRNERFMNVPLCQTECNAWWEDCKDDFTCVENWSRQFNWTSGTPKCPVGSSCRTFQQVFQTANNFCEKVWDESWQVVNDTHPGGCFLMWWQHGSEDQNPNYQVAFNKAQQIVSAAERLSIVNVLFLLPVSLLIHFVGVLKLKRNL